ncbi:MAG TPA: kelch repeat-containing protein, partial [Candidatus Binatus sp.]|nr:kelch repeat-containing protein [Candidatus Binatus sp.]
MAGLRDRPLTRDALLAGAIIAAGAVAALIGVDRGNAPARHFGFGPSSLAVSAGAASTAGSPGALTHPRRVSAPRELPRQMGLSQSKKKKSDDTVVMMVPDLPPRENPEPPAAGGWTEQGSAAPVSGANSQAPTLIAMSATGGVSQPLTSPTGNSLPGSSHGTSGGGTDSAPAPNSIRGGGNSGDGGRHVRGSGSGSHSGFVLLAGGQGGGKFALSSAEFFDPRKNTFAATSSMNVARTDHTATVLPGGQILIAGGEGASGRALSSAELYDPVSGKFSAIAATMSAARADHTATLISGCNCPADGKVLIAGGDTAASMLGSTLRSAELYDPATGTFAATGSMKATRTRHSATLLVSGPLAGEVLISGGFSDETAGD